MDAPAKASAAPAASPQASAMGPGVSPMEQSYLTRARMVAVLFALGGALAAVCVIALLLLDGWLPVSPMKYEIRWHPLPAPSMCFLK